MTKQSYRNSLILIVVTAAVLTGTQIYYTIKNYEANKQRFIQDVREALDTSIESYFADKAKNSIYVLSEGSLDTVIQGRGAMAFGSRVNNLDSLFTIVDKNSATISSGITHIWSKSDTISDSLWTDSVIRLGDRSSFKRLKVTAKYDSARTKELQFLTQKVMLSISEDLLDLRALYSVLEKELENKNLNIDFALTQENYGKKRRIGDLDDTNYLSTTSTSVFVTDLHDIGIDFENATLIILKNGLRELILSVLLIGLVIGTLVHLYRTIFAQKQLAAIKDDLISNITHEFKTPIATIFSALEGVTSFNETNDQEKTKRYLELSTDQLHKLNDMVEKMLETATIDQGKLALNKEELEVVNWTKELVNQFRLVAKEKKISFQSALSEVVSSVDRFHLENALSNLIDNAIKYGGENIAIRLLQNGEALIWEVEDDGGNIPSAQKHKVFDKLYRIPTGNQHDVKGFGIGLYYARTITEMHGGELTLDISGGRTLFRLVI